MFIHRLGLVWEEWTNTRSYLVVLRLLEWISFLFLCCGLSFFLLSFVNLFFVGYQSGYFLQNSRTQAYLSASVFGQPVSGHQAVITFDLIGTLSASDGQNFAILKPVQGQSTSAVYKVGDALPDGSVLREVGSDSVVLDVNGAPVKLYVKNRGEGIVRPV